MKSYTGHHTCSQDNGREHVLDHSPFPSTATHEPFLGLGYYFWDYNIQQSHDWGERLYGESYFIVEASINTTDDNFLDLVGDRKHLEYLGDLVIEYSTTGLRASNFQLGKFIEFLKDISKKDPSIFPFQIIRCQDDSVEPKKKHKIKFNSKAAYLNLNPRYIFCLVSVNNTILTDKSIIFPEQKPEGK